MTIQSILSTPFWCCQHPLAHCTLQILVNTYISNLINDSVLWFGCGWQQKCHAAAHPPAGAWRRVERNRQKLVGQDKGSLTEQQTKGTVITTIQISRKHNTNCTTQRNRSPGPDWRCTPEPRVNSGCPAPPHWNPAWRHMVWNTLLCLARWGQPAWLCPFLDSSEN